MVENVEGVTVGLSILADNVRRGDPVAKMIQASIQASPGPLRTLVQQAIEGEARTDVVGRLMDAWAVLDPATHAAFEAQPRKERAEAQAPLHPLLSTEFEPGLDEICRAMESVVQECDSNIEHATLLAWHERSHDNVAAVRVLEEQRDATLVALGERACQVDMYNGLQWVSIDMGQYGVIENEVRHIGNLMVTAIAEHKVAQDAEVRRQVEYEASEEVALTCLGRVTPSAKEIDEIAVSQMTLNRMRRGRQKEWIQAFQDDPAALQTLVEAVTTYMCKDAMNRYIHSVHYITLTTDEKMLSDKLNQDGDVRGKRVQEAVGSDLEREVLSYKHNPVVNIIFTKVQQALLDGEPVLLDRDASVFAVKDGPMGRFGEFRIKEIGFEEAQEILASKGLMSRDPARDLADQLTEAAAEQVRRAADVIKATSAHAPSVDAMGGVSWQQEITPRGRGRAELVKI